MSVQKNKNLATTWIRSWPLFWNQFVKSWKLCAVCNIPHYLIMSNITSGGHLPVLNPPIPSPPNTTHRFTVDHNRDGIPLVVEHVQNLLLKKWQRMSMSKHRATLTCTATLLTLSFLLLRAFQDGVKTGWNSLLGPINFSSSETPQANSVVIQLSAMFL